MKAAGQTKPERQSNLELLRILAMLAIVAGHFAGQGGFLWVVSGWKLLFIMLAGSGLRIAVNLFLMIGVWFMVDADFRASRIWKLYGVAAFYSVTLTLLMALLRVDAPKGDMVRVVLPFFGRPLWFASAYISLLMVSPYLKKLLAWEAGELQRLVILLFVLLSVVSTVPGYKESYVADFCWCMYIYLFIGCYKKTGRPSGKKRMVSLAVGTGIYLMLVLTRWLCTMYYTEAGFLSAGVTLMEQYISDIRSVPNFVSAFMIFVFFVHLDIGTKPKINYAAGTAFGVYAIHSVPAFHDFLWHCIYRCDAWKKSEWVCLYFSGVVLSVYVAASVIDRLRMRWLEPLWLKCRLFSFLCQKTDGFYKKEI